MTRGDPMGDKNVPVIFVITVKRPISMTWTRLSFQGPEARYLKVTTTIITFRIIDISFSAYADDLNKTAGGDREQGLRDGERGAAQCTHRKKGLGGDGDIGAHHRRGQEDHPEAHEGYGQGGHAGERLVRKCCFEKCFSCGQRKFNFQMREKEHKQMFHRTLLLKIGWKPKCEGTGGVGYVRGRGSLGED